MLWPLGFGLASGAQIWLFALRHWQVCCGVGCGDSHLCSLLALPAPHPGLKCHEGCRHQLGVVRKYLPFQLVVWTQLLPPTPHPPTRPNHRQLIWWLREEQFLGDKNPTHLPKTTTCGPQNHTQGLCVLPCYDLLLASDLALIQFNPQNVNWTTQW